MMRHELWKARRRGLNLGRENVSRALSLMRCLRVRLSWQRRHALLSGTDSPCVRCAVWQWGVCGLSYQLVVEWRGSTARLAVQQHSSTRLGSDYLRPRLIVIQRWIYCQWISLWWIRTSHQNGLFPLVDFGIGGDFSYNSPSRCIYFLYN